MIDDVNVEELLVQTTVSVIVSEYAIVLCVIVSFNLNVTTWGWSFHYISNFRHGIVVQEAAGWTPYPAGNELYVKSTTSKVIKEQASGSIS